jgi:hypothetical protein
LFVNNKFLNFISKEFFKELNFSQKLIINPNGETLNSTLEE